MTESSRGRSAPKREGGFGSLAWARGGEGGLGSAAPACLSPEAGDPPLHEAPRPLPLRRDLCGVHSSPSCRPPRCAGSAGGGGGDMPLQRSDTSSSRPHGGQACPALMCCALGPPTPRAQPLTSHQVGGRL